ncbi:MAG: hypothetical protein JWO42_256, partial [Chloroflexi bacterium]|nr:hypothetical protein [Chloroflexota bacterium]
GEYSSGDRAGSLLAFLICLHDSRFKLLDYAVDLVHFTTPILQRTRTLLQTNVYAGGHFQEATAYTVRIVIRCGSSEVTCSYVLFAN